ncbi:MAG TPA: alpha/beta hydrolase [Bradyrhizobium sp.]|jgi:pimeloyl-ACP methyl ester carboxylesterase|nr:alpha/beta hydrolase [Bradyrhizobium sp.]
MTVHYRQLAIDDVNVFYREAGNPDAPHVLLLHGFPTSSHMYRNLIPVLAERYHVVAPDLPGFGFTEAPAREHFSYRFETLTRVIERFTEKLGLSHFAMQVFDYGAPVGFRLALRHPERIAAIISQNGNAYEEGLSEGWNPIQTYWKHPTDANRAALRGFLQASSTKWQYTHGAHDASVIAPETYTLDQALLDRPGNDDIQLDLFLDYASNVALYPEFQTYFRKHKPRLLAVWGNKDPFFLPSGAEAFRRDNPNAEVQLVDAGHFALESKGDEIAAYILTFLGRVFD